MTISSTQRSANFIVANNIQSFIYSPHALVWGSNHIMSNKQHLKTSCIHNLRQNLINLKN